MSTPMADANVEIINELKKFIDSVMACRKEATASRQGKRAINKECTAGAKCFYCFAMKGYESFIKYLLN